MKTIKIFSLAALALLSVACSNDDDMYQSQPGGKAAATEGIPFTATISGEQTTTRGLTENGDVLEATWTVGDKIALVYGDNLVEATVDKVDETTKAAYLSATLTGSPKNGMEVKLIYPYSAVDASTKAVKADLLKTQDGSLATVENKLDVRQSAGAKLKITAEGTATLAGTPSLVNTYAIVKFSITQGGSAAPVNQLEIKNADDNMISTVTPASAASDLYVAMSRDNKQQSYVFSVTKGSDNYLLLRDAKLEAGQFYQSELSLTSSSGVAVEKQGKKYYVPDDSYTKVSSSTNFENGGTYVIDSNVELGDALIGKDVHLILRDDCTLTLNTLENKEMRLASLHVYGETGEGKKGNGLLKTKCLNVSGLYLYSGNIEADARTISDRCAISVYNLMTWGGSIKAWGGSYKGWGRAAINIAAASLLFGGKITAIGGKAGKFFNSAEAAFINQAPIIHSSFKGTLIAIGGNRLASASTYYSSKAAFKAGFRYTAGTIKVSRGTPPANYDDYEDADKWTTWEEFDPSSQTTGDTWNGQSRQPEDEKLSYFAIKIEPATP